MAYPPLASYIAVPHRGSEADFRRLAWIIGRELHEQLETSTFVQRSLRAYHHNFPETDVVCHEDVVVRVLLLPDCAPISEHCSARARFKFTLLALARLLLELLLDGFIACRPQDLMEFTTTLMAGLRVAKFTATMLSRTFKGLSKTHFSAEKYADYDHEINVQSRFWPD